MQTLKLLTKWDSFTSTSSFCIGELRIRCMSVVCVPSSTHAWWWNLGVVVPLFGWRELVLLVLATRLTYMAKNETWSAEDPKPTRLEQGQNGPISFWFWRSGLSLAKILWKFKGLWFLERWVVIRILLFSYESASLASLHSCGITRVTSFGGMLECQRKTSQHHS